ncbi:hypothetical protein N7532_005823 [Penicillium argentinense]|uniref:Uncharacterized protein n=1 Tax=Penicillium argentinense TaxID=1131581 RepID=A0A9W9KBC8_9EURO|nr:uncharacterized protein N7532_005823 [Penicillium argentinense]KAJ5098822.1 hypothetical protein N7532_005823 [Penicillium argentinense]
MARHPLVRACLLQGIDVPEWLRDDDLYPKEDPVLAPDALLARSASLRSKSLQTLQNPKFRPESQADVLRKLATEAQELDEAFEVWSKSSRDDWKFFVILSERQSDVIFEDHTHNYSTHSHATIWNRYRAARLNFNSICLRVIPNLSSDLSCQDWVDDCSQDGQAILDSQATDICRIVGFFYDLQRTSNGLGGETPRGISLLPPSMPFLGAQRSFILSTEVQPTIGTAPLPFDHAKVTSLIFQSFSVATFSIRLMISSSAAVILGEWGDGRFDRREPSNPTGRANLPAYRGDYE